jgi:hypothetical protein
MTISRRRVLQGSGAAIAVLGAVPTLAFETSALALFDSRHRASCVFAAARTATLDVAHEDARFWQTLRQAPLPNRIEGLTAWSDWVVVRGLLEERGKRVRTEVRRGDLFHWTMS